MFLHLQWLCDQACERPAFKQTADAVLRAELLSVLDEYDAEWRQWMMREFEKYPNKISGNEGSLRSLLLFLLLFLTSIPFNLQASIC